MKHTYSLVSMALVLFSVSYIFSQPLVFENVEIKQSDFNQSNSEITVNISG